VKRFALTLILAAVPLLAVGMLVQSEGASIGSLAGVSSVPQNSSSANQSFRGYWLDGSNFTQDAANSANGFLAGGNFPAIMRIDYAGRQIAPAPASSRQNFQLPQKTAGVSDSTKSGLSAQLANFNALYALLTHGGAAPSVGVSLAVYRQLVDQQFSVRRGFNTSVRTHFAYGSLVSTEKKSAAVSAADLQLARITAQQTEHAGDLRDITAARMKKTMQQRVYSQRPAPPQPNRLSGQAAPGHPEQNQRAAFAKLQVAYAGTKVFTELAPVKNLRLVNQPVSSSISGCGKSSNDAKPADQIELKVRVGAPIT